MFVLSKVCSGVNDNYPLLWFTPFCLTVEQFKYARHRSAVLSKHSVQTDIQFGPTVMVSSVHVFSMFIKHIHCNILAFLKKNAKKNRQSAFCVSPLEMSQK